MPSRRIEDPEVASVLRRCTRHLQALAEMDADAGHVEASLVRLLRDWHRLGLWGGAKMQECADFIEEQSERFR